MNYSKLTRLQFDSYLESTIYPSVSCEFSRINSAVSEAASVKSMEFTSWELGTMKIYVSSDLPRHCTGVQEKIIEILDGELRAGEHHAVAHGCLLYRLRRTGPVIESNIRIIITMFTDDANTCR